MGSSVSWLVIFQIRILQYQWGCNVGCPFIGRPFDDNWGLEDPTGKSDEEFKIVIEKIRKDILKLKNGLDKR